MLWFKDLGAVDNVLGIRLSAPAMASANCFGFFAYGSLQHASDLTDLRAISTCAYYVISVYYGLWEVFMVKVSSAEFQKNFGRYQDLSF